MNTTTPTDGTCMLLELVYGNIQPSPSFFRVGYWTGKTWLNEDGTPLAGHFILARHPLPERAQVVRENTDLATEIEKAMYLDDFGQTREDARSIILNAINRFRKERK